MPNNTDQKHRTNRVFKSMHKPLTYLGVERTLFYFVCVGAVGAFNLFNTILAGIAVFIGGFAFGHWVEAAIADTSKELHAYINAHAEFSEIGNRMLQQWAEGVVLSLNAV